MVEYIGYGGGRGSPTSGSCTRPAGYAHLVMDTRGQGSGWSVGDTPDPGRGGRPAHPGFMTRGILDPATTTTGGVFTDAVRAVEAVRGHWPSTPPGSPSPAAARAAASPWPSPGSSPDLAGVMPDVPFLCDFPRAITFADTDPTARSCATCKAHRDQVEAVLGTLSYFDGANLGRRAIGARALLGRR